MGERFRWLFPCFRAGGKTSALLLYIGTFPPTLCKKILFHIIRKCVAWHGIGFRDVF